MTVHVQAMTQTYKLILFQTTLPSVERIIVHEIVLKIKHNFLSVFEPDVNVLLGPHWLVPLVNCLDQVVLDRFNETVLPTDCLLARLTKNSDNVNSKSVFGC